MVAVSDIPAVPPSGTDAPAAGAGVARQRARKIRHQLQSQELAANRVALLLAEAHAMRDWVPLGYSGYRTYVQRELGLAHAHAYRLLGLAQTITELAGAADISPYDIPPIPERKARRLKPLMPDLVAELRPWAKGRGLKARQRQILELVERYAKVSPAGDTSGGSLERAVSALVACEKDCHEPDSFASRLVEAVDACIRHADDARARWADHLADAAAALRELAGRPGSLRPRGRPTARAPKPGQVPGQTTFFDFNETEGPIR